MADPLSIAVSVLALIGATDGAIRSLKTLLGTDDAVLAVLNEVTDLKHVLLSISNVVESSKNAPAHLMPLAGRITETLQATRRNIDEIDRIFHEKILRHGSTQFERPIRKAWYTVNWMRERSRVLKLKEEIKQLTRNLHMHLTSFTAASQMTMHLNVTKITEATAEMKLDQRLARQLLTKHPSRVAPVKDTGILTTPRSIDLDAYHRTEVNSDPRRLLGFPEAQGVQPISGRASGQYSIDQYVAGNSKPHDTPSYQSVSVQSSLCATFCDCVCHRANRLHSPRSLNRILGSLFIGYSGIPSIASSSCSEKLCKRRSEVALTYYFPQWFIAKVISLAVISSSIGNISIGLRFNPVLPADQDIFRYADSNVSELEDTIAANESLVHAVDHVNGWNVLRFVLSRYVFDSRIASEAAWEAGRRLEVAQKLIKMGCDPLLEDQHQWTMVDSTFTTLLTTRKYHSSKTKFLSMFGHYENTFLRRQDFGRLHKIVLGYSSIDLEDQLALSKADIDIPDSYGRTALTWAAARNDVRSMRILMDAGASLDVCDNLWGTPLHHAAVTGSPAAASLLIQRGSEVNRTNRFGRNPFQEIRFYRDLRFDTQMFRDDSYRELLKILLDAGLNPQSQARGGCTPLLAAIWLQLEHHYIDRLIRDGADLNGRHEDGHTALHRASLKSSATIVQTLLAANPDVNARNRNGETPLHYAAMNTNPDSVDIIQSLINHGADVDARDYDYETPLSRASRNYSAADQDVNALCLLENGAEIESQNWRGTTPLLTAVGWANTRVAEVLLRRGAKVTTVEPRGHTILHVAASAMTRSIIKALHTAAVENPSSFRGLDVNAKNRSGRTALDIYRWVGNLPEQHESDESMDSSLYEETSRSRKAAEERLNRFKGLLALVRSLQDQAATSDSMGTNIGEDISAHSSYQDDPDEFFDAVETQDLEEQVESTRNLSSEQVQMPLSPTTTVQ